MKPKPQDWKTGLKKLNEIHFGKPMKHQEDWEKRFEEKFNENAYWKIGTMNNYKGGGSDCSHDLTGENRNLKKALKQFISKLLEEQEKQIKKANYYGIGVSQYEEIFNKGIKVGMTLGKSELKDKIKSWADKEKREELFVGETQYRQEKGNIAFVYNMGLDDLLKFIDKL